jgi:serine protease Do
MEKNKHCTNYLIFIVIFFMAILTFLIHRCIKYQIIINACSAAAVNSEDYFIRKENNFKKIIWENQRFMVSVQDKKESEKYSAVGFLCNNKGYILTSADLAKGLKEVYVKFSCGEVHKCFVTAVENKFNLALIKIPNFIDVPNPKIASRVNINLGDEIIYLNEFEEIPSKINTGNVSKIIKDFNGSKWEILSKEPIKYSGLPIFGAEKGEIIAINVLNKKENGFQVVPIKEIFPIVESWSKNSEESLDNNLKLKLSKKAAKYMVQYFYDSINCKDYVSAYSIMSENYKKSENYHCFAKNFENIDNINLINIETKSVNNTSEEVIAHINISKGKKQERKTVKFQVIFEDKVIKIKEYFHLS